MNMAGVNSNHAPRVGGGPQLDKFLSITLGENRYGIDVLRIREIIEYATITPVPMMPPFVRGSINLRGKGVPVIDLAIRFGRGETEVRRRTCIVIVEMNPEGGSGEMVGLLVDAVNEVVDLDAGEIEPSPNFGGKLRTEFMRGMAKVKGEFVILLDIDRVLAVDEFSQVMQALTEN